MLTRSKLKLGEGESVETNPEIGRVYPQKKMSEEGSVGPDPQFIDSFLAMRSMVEEMYRDFRKHKDEDSLGSKQDKGEEESLLHDHSKGKAKEENFLAPPNSPEHKNKTSLIKLDLKFDLPIYDGELNAEKLDNWIRQIDVHCKVQSIDSDKRKIQLASLCLGGIALVWWEGRTQTDMKKHGKILSVWSEFVSAIKKQFYSLAYIQQAMMSWQTICQLKRKSVQGYT